MFRFGRGISLIRDAEVVYGMLDDTFVLGEGEVLSQFCKCFRRKLAG